jgi:hypothetical protein
VPVEYRLLWEKLIQHGDTEARRKSRKRNGRSRGFYCASRSSDTEMMENTEVRYPSSTGYSGKNLFTTETRRHRRTRRSVGFCAASRCSDAAVSQRMEGRRVSRDALPKTNNSQPLRNFPKVSPGSFIPPGNPPLCHLCARIPGRRRTRNFLRSPSWSSLCLRGELRNA